MESVTNSNGVIDGCHSNRRLLNHNWITLNKSTDQLRTDLFRYAADISATFWAGWMTCTCGCVSCTPRWRVHPCTCRMRTTMEFSSITALHAMDTAHISLVIHPSFHRYLHLWIWILMTVITIKMRVDIHVINSPVRVNCEWNGIVRRLNETDCGR